MAGAAGLAVSIVGNDLTSVTSVKFNGADASFKFFGGEIVAVVPTNATTGPITLASPSGTATTSNSFTVVASTNAAPQITGFSPASGGAGTKVIIFGSNFDPVTSVQFNGVASDFVVFSGQLIATVPAGATTGLIKIASPSGTVSSATVFSVAVDLKPVITSFSPTNGAAGTAVLITGSNLDPPIAVRFNAKDASFLAANGVISATVPTGASSGTITVVTAAGEAQSAQPFTVLTNVASIKSFSPASGAVGTLVTITAQGFQSVLAVKFNGVAAAFNFFPGQITAVVPTNATTGPITIVTPEGSASSSTNFVVDMRPDIFSFSPGQGAVGTEVLLTGKNLDFVTSVAFQAIPAQFSHSGSNLLVTVPRAAVSSPITVTNTFGSAVTAGDFLVGTNAALSMRLNGSSFTAQAGSSVMVVFAIENHGPLIASNALLHIIVPEDIAIPSMTIPQGVSARVGDNVIFSLGELPPKWVGAVFMTLQPSQAGDSLLNATITSSIPDSDLSDNSAQVKLHVDGTPVVVPPPPLKFSVTASNHLELRWVAQNQWVLQQTDSLTPPIQWKNFESSAVVSSAGTNSATVITDAPKKFFRLGSKTAAP